MSHADAQLPSVFTLTIHQLPGSWSCQMHEHDIAAEGSSPAAMFEELEYQVAAHLALCKEYGQPETLPSPVSAEAIERIKRVCGAFAEGTA